MSVVRLSFAARAQDLNTTRCTVFSDDVWRICEAKREHHSFLYCLFHILFYPGRTTTFLALG